MDGRNIAAGGFRPSPLNGYNTINSISCGAAILVALDEHFHHNGTKTRSWRFATSISPGFQNRPLLIDHCSLIFERSADAYGNTLIFSAPDSTGNWWGDAAVQSDYGANEIIYCGYRYDPEAQNYYVRDRTYNPVLGRWIQRDPIGISGGINLYGYVGAVPVMVVDPCGLIHWGVLLEEVVNLTVGAAVFGLGVGLGVAGVGIPAVPVLFVGGGFQGTMGLLRIAAASGPSQIAADASKLPVTPGDIVALNARALGATKIQWKVVGDTFDFATQGGTDSLAETSKWAKVAKMVTDSSDYKTWTGNACASVNAAINSVPDSLPPTPQMNIRVRGYGRAVLTAPAKFSGHIVERGDSLWSLWRRAGGTSTGVSWAEMLRANRFLKNPDVLTVGWGVLVPNACVRTSN